MTNNNVLKILQTIFTIIIFFFPLSCTTQSVILESGTELYRCDPEKGKQLVKIPGWKSVWHVIGDCSVAKPAEVSIAMKIFYMHWLETFGDPVKKVKNNLHKMMILWGDKARTTSGYRMDGSYKKDIKAIGIAHTKSTVWVKKDNQTKICNSSLTHELVHASIWAIKGTDADPDHLGDKYVGWTIDHSAMINTVKAELCLLGI